MENKPKFKAGDVVQLKSGGPKMTVDEFAGEGYILKCHFFNETRGAFESNDFSFKVLKLAEESDPSF